MLMQITNPSTKIALKIHAAKCFKLTDMLLALLFTVPTVNKYNHQVPAARQVLRSQLMRGASYQVPCWDNNLAKGGDRSH